MKIEMKKERTHLFAPNINIAIVMSFAKIVSDTDLLHAVSASFKNNEVLNCKITFDDSGKAFYETAKNSEPILKRFEGNWKDIISEQEKIPFDLLKGELIRFFVKNDHNKTQLLIIAHHLVGDGLAMTYFVKDIIKGLNGKELHYKKLEVFNMNNVPKNSKLNLFLRIMLRGINGKWNKTGKIFSISDYEDMFQKYWESRKTKIQNAVIKEECLECLEKEAKLHNITLNSIIVTALAKACGDKTEIGISVSLREKENHSMANHSTAITVNYNYDDNMNFGENAVQSHQSIYQKLGDHKRKFFLTQFMNSISVTLIDAAYFTAFGGYVNKVANSISNMFGYTKKPKAINISNLTKIDLEQEHMRYPLDNITFVPPIVPNASFMIGVVTNNRKMELTLHAMDDDEFAKKSEVFNHTMSILTKLE